MIINVAPQASIATTPDPPSVANGGFAPLCGAAATPVAALKAPVASQEEGTTGRQPAVGAATQPAKHSSLLFPFIPF